MKKPNAILLNMRNNRDYDHPLNHKIKKQFIYNIDGILYEVCVAVPFLRQNDDPYERDSFFKLEQFLKFLLQIEDVYMHGQNIKISRLILI